MSFQQTCKPIFFIIFSICLAQGSARGKPRRVRARPLDNMETPATPVAYRNTGTVDFDAVGELNHLMDKTASRVGPMAFIMLRDGKTIYQKGFRGATVETPLPIASGSKWLIAATLMTLVDDGLVGLDDPIGRYLPSFTGEKGTITLRQLLSHTSGLPSSCKTAMISRRGLETIVDRVGRRVRLSSAPGERFRYGNLSFKVAARLAEVVVQKPWPAIFTERLAGPTGMRNTAVRASGLGLSINNLQTSVADYATFLTMFQNDGVSASGRRVLSKAAIDEMKRSQTTGLEMDEFNERQHARAGRTEYGLGVWRERVDPITKKPEAVSHFGYPGFRGVINYRLGYTMVLAVKVRKPWVRQYIRRRFSKTLTLVDQLARVTPQTIAF